MIKPAKREIKVRETAVASRIILPDFRLINNNVPAESMAKLPIPRYNINILLSKVIRDVSGASKVNKIKTENSKILRVPAIMSIIPIILLINFFSIS